MGVGFLKKISVKIEKRQNRIFSYPVAEQKKYVEKFPKPSDNFERSYFQYCCQMKLYGKPLHFLLNCAALPVSLFYLFKFKKCNTEFTESADAVFFHGGKPENIIPISLRDRFKNIVPSSADRHSLTEDDIKFLKKLFIRFPLSWFLWLKCIIKISQYSSAVSEYAPKAIISCDEFSFTSSVLTEYCHTKNVSLINIMHGEKLYFMRDSFVNYDEFFVWSKAYADLFISLRASKDQFKIEVPPSLLIKENGSICKKYDFTYYLASEKTDELREIGKNLSILKNHGLKIAVRPHPRYSDTEEIKQIFKFADIEDTEKITIEESLLQTENAVSLYSTVLNQAYHAGINIVIDDISGSEKYAKLKELQYAMLSEKHTLLSETVKSSI